VVHLLLIKRLSEFHGANIRRPFAISRVLSICSRV
jgi:hypothetical protein